MAGRGTSPNSVNRKPHERERISKLCRPVVTDRDAVWLAAVLDCEGSIGILRCRRPHGYVYCPTLFVGNTDRRLIDELHARFGGRVYFRARPFPAKDIWHWRLNRIDEVKDKLIAVRPYLVL